jgi:hypothetical protein
MVYPKIIKMIIFIKLDAITKLLRGVIINNTINAIDINEHKQTFLVTLSYSILNIGI